MSWFTSIAFGLPRYIWGLLILAAIVAAVLWLRGGGVEQAKQDTRSAGALAEAAEVAVDTVVARADAEASVDDLVTAAIEEIDNAPSDQAAGAAARVAICQLPDFGHDPACRVQPVYP